MKTCLRKEEVKVSTKVAFLPTKIGSSICWLRSYRVLKMLTPLSPEEETTYYSANKVRPPKYGDYRIIKKFIWWSLSIGGKKVWWEEAELEQLYWGKKRGWKTSAILDKCEI